HVIDASRAVGVVSKLLNPNERDVLINSIHSDYDRIRLSRKAKSETKHLTLEESRNRKYQIDWKTYQFPRPNKQGIQVFYDNPLEELIDYIDWSPFFHAWEMKGIYPNILQSKKYGDEAIKLYSDGRNLLERIIQNQHFTAKAVIGIYPAHAIDETVYIENTAFYFPRQLIDKGIDSPNYSLADFIAPKGDFMGLFALTTGIGVKELALQYEKQNDDYNAIMVKVLADRLAEALAEQ
ncbi:uncharacterized protein METZ01_LOCUS494881, partial [marine metagenome]